MKFNNFKNLENATKYKNALELLENLDKEIISDKEKAAYKMLEDYDKGLITLDDFEKYI